jgi:hypothetical protein
MTRSAAAFGGVDIKFGLVVAARDVNIREAIAVAIECSDTAAHHVPPFAGIDGVEAGGFGFVGKFGNGERRGLYSCHEYTQSRHASEGWHPAL